MNSAEHPLNSGVAFNSQRLHESRAKGVLELHLLQKEAAQLVTQYQSSVPQDEMVVRQIQHSQFHVQPVNVDLPAALYQCTLKQQQQQTPPLATATDPFYNKQGVGDLAAPFLGLFGKEQQATVTKPPLQQQLMQHRLLQQKRQILQKQGALENLSRRQMLRQHR